MCETWPFNSVLSFIIYYSLIFESINNDYKMIGMNECKSMHSLPMNIIVTIGADCMAKYQHYAHTAASATCKRCCCHKVTDVNKLSNDRATAFLGTLSVINVCSIRDFLETRDQFVHYSAVFIRSPGIEPISRDLADRLWLTLACCRIACA